MPSTREGRKSRVQDIRAEARCPALIDVVKIMSAERRGDVEREFLKHLLHGQQLDLDLDAGRLLEMPLELRVEGLGRRGRFRRELQRRVPANGFATSFSQPMMS